MPRWSRSWQRQATISDSVSLSDRWRRMSYVCSDTHRPWLDGCCSFRSWQHLRSYEVGYRLVTVRSHGDFTVLPYWDTWPQLPIWSHYPNTDPGKAGWRVLSYPVLCANLIMLSIRLGSNKSQFCKSLIWLSHIFYSWPSTWEACALPIRRTHPVYRLYSIRNMYHSIGQSKALLSNTNMQ